MLSLGALSFMTPWVLGTLIALPAIWWLLRVTPPLPQRIKFPALTFLLNITQEDQTSTHTPWWLLLLRLVIATLIILALADPVLNPTASDQDSDVTVLVVDDSWSAAPTWTKRQAVMQASIDQAERDERPLMVITTASSFTMEDIQTQISLLTAQDARGITKALQPKAWLPNRKAAIDKLAAARAILEQENLRADVTWMSDALDHGHVDVFMEALDNLGDVNVLYDPPNDRAWALIPPQATTEGFNIFVHRSPNRQAQEGQIHVLGDKNRILAATNFLFEPNAQDAEVNIDLPLELRNQAQRIEVIGQNSTGGVTLLDERWRRRLVGLATGGNVEASQPLLSELYYLERALDPYTEIRKGAISDLIKQGISVLIIADRGQIIGEEGALVEDWVSNGGLLLRFAGPRMASQTDALTPVQLRQGGRALGGALSWAEPQQLGPFPEGSPFFGLTVPDDLTITRQVLAQPSIDLPERTWARLVDGTPLVTAAAKEKGWLVLFHVTASPNWSNLPLTGLYVDMLRRVTNLASGQRLQGAATPEEAAQSSVATRLRPLRELDGFGALREPGPTVKPIPTDQLSTLMSGPEFPPGIYGSEQTTYALNAVGPDIDFQTIKNIPSRFTSAPFTDVETQSLKARFLVLSFILILADSLIALYLSGRLRLIPLKRAQVKRAASIVTVMALMTGLWGTSAIAQDDVDAFALQATLETPLAYVMTGNREVDEMSEAGLWGLSRALFERTAMEPADPLGIDIERDELAFFPLIYWPVTKDQAGLSPTALAKIDTYMKNGGTILFDTRDHQTAIPGVSNLSGNATLKRLLSSLDIPPLEPVPAEHVLTKAFYLLQDFPGRWSGGRVWVEARDTVDEPTARSSNDGVSAIIIGSNDYAAAWAEDGQGRPMAAVVPGGQRQREMALRFGVNVVMYTLTGNYKADQVHVPALLERLGQ